VQGTYRVLAGRDEDTGQEVALKLVRSFTKKSADLVFFHRRFFTLALLCFLIWLCRGPRVAAVCCLVRPLCMNPSRTMVELLLVLQLLMPSSCLAAGIPTLFGHGQAKECYVMAMQILGKSLQVRKSFHSPRNCHLTFSGRTFCWSTTTASRLSFVLLSKPYAAAGSAGSLADLVITDISSGVCAQPTLCPRRRQAVQLPHRHRRES
jgi:hypothetical protein